MTGAPWYALQIGGGAGFREGRRIVPEFAAVEAIGDDGHTVFAPTRRILVKRHRHEHRREPAYVPLAPGYVFAQFSIVPGYSKLRRWANVVDLVRMQERPVTIPLRQIEAIRALDEADTEIDVTGKPGSEPLERLAKVGDTVEHRGAALGGVPAQVLEVHRREAVLLVEFLGGLVRMRAPVADLEVLERAR
jgi:transcription antitermination factor NusG